MKKIYFLKILLMLLLSVSISAALRAQNFNLIDINKIKNSNPKDIVVSGGKLYFVAYYANVQRLWESDGTEAGTILLTDFNQGKFEPELSYLTDANGTLYFINHFWICDSTYTICNPYNQLWKTDGTEAGTVMVADLNTPEFNYSYDAQNLVNVNGKL